MGKDGASVASEHGFECYLTAFFDELTAWGVRDIVVSPGSRSTGLSVCAFELSQRFPDRLRVMVDVDERGAGFVALGMAKASGRPVAVIGTSGTAIANYYPAVLEAETSRVPLIVLSSDRPEYQQGVGAPQTMDQLKLFGDHVRLFKQMPEPAGGKTRISFARQMAREACMAALGAGAGMTPVAGHPIAARSCAHKAGPVHLNFPLEEPRKPDFSFGFECELCADVSASPVATLRMPAVGALVSPDTVAVLQALIEQGGALVLAGEGTAETVEEAEEICQWAEACGLPVLADPLSGMRDLPSSNIIANYDNIWADPSALAPRVVIRFGRFSIAKRVWAAVSQACEKGCVQVVVDAAERRDLITHTDSYLACRALDLARSFNGAGEGVVGAASAAQAEYLAQWKAADAAAQDRICCVEADAQACVCDDASEMHCARGPEGAYVRALLQTIPGGSVFWCSNSMAIRVFDTFYTADVRPLKSPADAIQILGNRGLNGIDGTTSSAVGAALANGQATLLTGDLSFIHDLNALALQQEFLQHSGREVIPSLVIVLFNNSGAAIFEIVSQKSDDAYFERLFLVPQTNQMHAAADAFFVPYKRATTVDEFKEAYANALGTPGITLIEVPTQLGNVPAHYSAYQS